MKLSIKYLFTMSFCIALIFVYYYIFFDKTLTDEAFFEEAIELMEEQSIHKERLDWEKIKSSVKEYTKTESRKSTALMLLKLIETNHSFFREKDRNLLAFYSDLNCKFQYKEEIEIPNDIGYIRVDGFSSKDNKQRIEYATQLQNYIRQKDNAHLKGWIVDLRYNTGGSMYPMIAGLGPLFGNNKVGYFINPNKAEDDKEKVIPYGYYNGSTIIRYRRLTVDNPYSMSHPNKLTLVLTSKLTSSSGEAIAIAFKRRANTIQIGEKTCGMATVNKTIQMSDNSQLILTTSYMADREMNIYEYGVNPDKPMDAKDSLSYSINYLRNR